MDWLLEPLLHHLPSEEATLAPGGVKQRAGCALCMPLGQLGGWAGLRMGVVTLARLEEGT